MLLGEDFGFSGVKLAFGLSKLLIDPLFDWENLLKITLDRIDWTFELRALDVGNILDYISRIQFWAFI
jgi:hypothetical protein